MNADSVESAAPVCSLVAADADYVVANVGATVAGVDSAADAAAP